MDESIRTTKLLHNNIISPGRFKKNDISRQYKLLIYFTIDIIWFDGILVP